MPHFGSTLRPEVVVGEIRQLVRELSGTVDVQSDAQERLVVAPLVGDLLAGVALAVHRQVEAAAARAVGVIEREPSFVQPDLQRRRPGSHLQTAAGQNERSLRHLSLRSWGRSNHIRIRGVHVAFEEHPSVLFPEETDPAVLRDDERRRGLGLADAPEGRPVPHPETLGVHRRHRRRALGVAATW